MRTHPGEKPYQYIHCDRALAFKNTFDQHMNIHSGEKKDINAVNVRNALQGRVLCTSI